MVLKTKPRTSIRAREFKDRIGFKSKQRLRAEGFLQAEWKFEMKSGLVRKEVGFSTGGIPANDWRVMIEDSRLNAISVLLYRQGYFVSRENYEDLDEDIIRSSTLLTYDFYYTQNQFMKYSKYKSRGNEFIAERNSRGRFTKGFPVRSVESADEQAIKRQVN